MKAAAVLLLLAGCAAGQDTPVVPLAADNVTVVREAVAAARGAAYGMVTDKLWDVAEELGIDEVVAQMKENGQLDELEATASAKVEEMIASLEQGDMFGEMSESFNANGAEEKADMLMEEVSGLCSTGGLSAGTTTSRMADTQANIKTKFRLAASLGLDYQRNSIKTRGGVEFRLTFPNELKVAGKAGIALLRDPKLTDSDGKKVEKKQLKYKAGLAFSVHPTEEGTIRSPLSLSFGFGAASGSNPWRTVSVPHPGRDADGKCVWKWYSLPLFEVSVKFELPAPALGCPLHSVGHYFIPSGVGITFAQWESIANLKFTPVSNVKEFFSAVKGATCKPVKPKTDLTGEGDAPQDDASGSGSDGPGKGLKATVSFAYSVAKLTPEAEAAYRCPDATSAPQTAAPDTDAPTAAPTAAPATPAPATPAPATPAPATPAPATAAPNGNATAPPTTPGRFAAVQQSTSLIDQMAGTLMGLHERRLETSYCFGDCTAEPLSATSSLSGLATVETDRGCNKLTLTAASDLVTLGGIGHAVGAGDWAEGGLRDSGFSSLGVAQASAEFESGLDGKVVLEVAGRPSFEDTPLDFLGDTSLPVRLTVEHQVQYWRLRFAVETAADQSDSVFRITDVEGKSGVSLFMQYSTFGAFGGIPATQYKARLPVSVCVEACEDAARRRDIYFSGELGFTFNPTPQLSGDLVAGAWWYKAFGLPFIHIGDMMLGLDVDIATAVPTRLAVGGAVCLGSQGNCQHRAEPYVEARAYVGLSARQVEENYFIAMVTRLTIGDVIDIFAEYADGLRDVKRALGPATLGSGIYPWDETKCGSSPAFNSTDASTLDLDCYAYVSFSLVDKELAFSPQNTVTIASGIQVRGVLNLFGWEVRSYVRIDERAVVINASMDPLVLRVGGFDLLRIGHHLDSHGKAVGGPNFFMKLVALPPQAAIDINGAFNMPLLGTSAAIAVRLDKDLFKFETSLDLLWGAFRSDVRVEWDWEFNYFLMRIQTSMFFPLVSLKDVSFEYSKALARGRFSVTINVLAIADLGAEVTIAQADDDAFQLGFAVRAAFLGAWVEISGDATVGGGRSLGDTEWSLDVEGGFDLDQLAADLNKAVTFVAEKVSEAWNAVTEKVSEAWNVVTEKVGAWVSGVAQNVKSFFTNLWNNSGLKKLFDAGLKLIAGKVADFFKGVGESIKNLFVKETVKNRSVRRLSRQNEYSCHIMRDEWTVRSCGRAFGLICKERREHVEYADRECMKRRARELVEAHDQGKTAERKQETLDESRRKNPGHAAVIAGARVPLPRLNTIKHKMRNSSDSARVAASVDAGVRALAGEGGGSSRDASVLGSSSSPFQDSETSLSSSGTIDFSSPAAFEATAHNLRADLLNQMVPAVTATQAGLSEGVQAEAGIIVYDKPVLGQAEDVTIGCADEPDFFATSPRVTYVDPRCGVGAKVVLVLEEDLTTPPFETYACGSEFVRLVWQAVDSPLCGGRSNTVQQLVTVLPGKLELTAVPADRTITTADSLGPEALGMPEWDAACEMSTAFDYEDSAPVAVAGTCGHWTILRKWTVSVDFDETNANKGKCTQPAALTHTQRITVRDVAHPEFIDTPDREVRVAFLEDYGPNTTGVPLVEDIARDAAIAQLGLVSYNVTLVYEDKVAFAGRPGTGGGDSCVDGVAVVTRTWTAQDACANTGSWVQTVRVNHPRAGGEPGLFGNMSRYQVASAWSVQARRTSVAGGLGARASADLDLTSVDGHVHTGGSDDVFADAADEITEFSEGLRMLPDLRTGPQHIVCADQNQSLCTHEATPPSTSEVVFSADGQDVVLRGDGLVYNVFTMTASQWLVQETKPYYTFWGRYVPGRYKGVMTVDAPGFVLVNVEYGRVPFANAVRDVVFAGDALGEEHLVFNMKQLCDYAVYAGGHHSSNAGSCEYHAWRYYRHHHLRYSSLLHYRPGCFRSGLLHYEFLFSNVTLRGTLISQDRRAVLTFRDSTVLGQVVVAANKLIADNTTFACGSFAPNTPCEAAQFCSASFKL